MICRCSDYLCISCIIIFQFVVLQGFLTFSFSASCVTLSLLLSCAGAVRVHSYAGVKKTATYLMSETTRPTRHYRATRSNLHTIFNPAGGSGLTFLSCAKVRLIAQPMVLPSHSQWVLWAQPLQSDVSPTKPHT